MLGAAGLLNGYRATTHWASHDQLAMFGAIPVHERWVIDRNRVTGGGVTAGIDFALKLAALMQGEAAAQAIQLGIEYNPAPPFWAGSPEGADPGVVQAVGEAMAPMLQKRLAASQRAAHACGNQRRFNSLHSPFATFGAGWNIRRADVLASDIPSRP